MPSVSNFIFYILIFLSVYVQVFFFITFLENRKKMVVRKGKSKLTHYPGVTIVVPCWNEERTVYKTVRSIFGLNYPKNKLKIVLIDDGSTDGTWEIIKKFEKYPNVKVFRKGNGGKHTALNLALSQLETEFVGGLDADSIIDPESLTRIMSCFEKDPDLMAVAPSVIVNNPGNFIQKAQKADYHMGVYFKKMLSFLGAINVTPGPLTVFRKKVFDDLGPYRHGHNTEDMEIAYRMQKNRYKIEHCLDAYVYTNTPATGRKLFRQRLRWIYGFVNNTIDYRNIFLKKKYGNFSTFTLPMGVISVISVVYLFGKMIYSISDYLYSKIEVYRLAGFDFASFHPSFDPFFFNVQSLLFLVVFIYSLIIFSMMLGRKMTEGKWGLSLSMAYFFPVFLIIAPLGLLKAVYSTILRRKPSWR